MSSNVCSLKSARWLGKFRQYGRPRFWKKIKMAAKYIFLNKASEVSISTEIDLLITNMIIFSRLYASFLVKVAKNVKNWKKKTCQLTEYIDIALSDLVDYLRTCFAKYAHLYNMLMKLITILTQSYTLLYALMIFRGQKNP